MKDILKWVLTDTEFGEEFLCTRSTFVRIRKRIDAIGERNKKGVIRHRREGNVVFFWRSR